MGFQGPQVIKLDPQSNPYETKLEKKKRIFPWKTYIMILDLSHSRSAGIPVPRSTRMLRMFLHFKLPPLNCTVEHQFQDMLFSCSQKLCDVNLMRDEHVIRVKNFSVIQHRCCKGIQTLENQ